MGKFCIHFQTKMAQKPYPLGGTYLPVYGLYKEVPLGLSLIFTNFCWCWQVKPNQFSVSYHIAQYTNIIADLRKEIFRLKLKISEHDTESNDGNSSSKFLKDNTLNYQLSLIEVIIIKHVIDFSVPVYSFYFWTSWYVERKRKDIIACEQAILGPLQPPWEFANRLRTLAWE